MQRQQPGEARGIKRAAEISREAPIVKRARAAPDAPMFPSLVDCTTPISDVWEGKKKEDKWGFKRCGGDRGQKINKGKGKKEEESQRRRKDEEEKEKKVKTTKLIRLTFSLFLVFSFLFFEKKK